MSLASPPKKEFTWVEGLALCLAMIGVQLCSEVINQWGLYFYSPSGGVGRTIYVSVGLVGIIFIIGTIWDAFSSPLIGAISDKTSTRPGRWRILPIPGRRLPYIFWGALLMIFTMIAFWFPPVNGSSWLNLVYGTVLLCAHWTLFSLAVVPLNALGPEIARSESARVALGTWTAFGMILGLALANALPGVLIAALDPGRVPSSLALTLPSSVPREDVDAAVHKLFSGDPELAARISAEKDGFRVAGFDAEDLRLVQNDAGWLVSIQGSLYAALRQSTIKTAVDSILPEDLRGKYTPLHRKAYFGVELLPDTALSADALDAIRARADIFITQSNAARPVIVFTKAVCADLAYGHLLEQLEGLSPPPSLTRREESYSPTGYRRVATVFAFLSFLLFLLPVLLIRERYDSAAVESEPMPWGSSVYDALRNKPFLIYAAAFFFFSIGFLAVQRALPYWAELGLDGDESTITRLLVPFILVAIASYAVIPIVSRYLHMKWMIFIALAIIATGMPCMYVIGQSNASFATRQLWGMILFGYCGIGQAIIYVMMVPMIGDIIDYDERRSGERREALYNGLSAFVWKASMAGSVLLASQSMNLWGNTVERYTGVLLVGPFAGLFGLIGMGIICLYPVRDTAAPHQGAGREAKPAIGSPP